MDISRRHFLGIASTGMLATFIAPGALFRPSKLKKGTKFNPFCEYSNGIPLASSVKYSNLPELVKHILHKDAKRILPKGTIYEIRAKVPQYYGRDKRIAWYYNSYMEQQVIGDLKSIEYIPEYGYILVGRYRV